MPVGKQSKKRRAIPRCGLLVASAFAVWLASAASAAERESRASAGGIPAPTRQPFPVTATAREAYRGWMLDHARALKAALEVGGDEGRSRLGRLLHEPVAQAVDWASFLADQPEAWDFPQMMVLNHSWFVWKMSLGFDRPAFPNVLPGGEVPNSAFFLHTEINSYTPEWLRNEVAEIRPAGEVTVTRPKKGGTAEGFFGKDRRGREYIFVFDPPFNPEMVTAAEYVGSTLMRMAGYNVPRTAVCRINCPQRPEYHGRRAVATIALEGFEGTWTYRANRHRRELRGLRVLAAWLHNVDQTSQNTANSVRDGVALRYIFDFGASLGSFTYRAKWPGLGEHYLFAPTGHLGGAVTGGEWRQPFTLQTPAVGYFPRKVDPLRWRPFYRNFAFEAAALEDNRWGARLLAQFSDDQIRTVVQLAGYTHRADTEFITRTLIARRNQLVEYYLGDAGLTQRHGAVESAKQQTLKPLR